MLQEIRNSLFCSNNRTYPDPTPTRSFNTHGFLKKHYPQKKWNPPALPLEAIPWAKMATVKKHYPQKKWNPPALPLEAIPWNGNGNHWHEIKNRYTSVVCVCHPAQNSAEIKTQMLSPRKRKIGFVRYCSWFTEVYCTRFKNQRSTRFKKVQHVKPEWTHITNPNAQSAGGGRRERRGKEEGA